MPQTAQEKKRFVPGWLAIVCLVFLAGLPPVFGRVFISEFVALNTTGLPDEDREASDWVEIHNAGSSAVNLEGWSLTDDPETLDQWQFPSVALPAGGRLVVFASGKDRRGSELHASFRLAGEGGYLALVRPDGATVEHAYEAYPAQEPDVAYGLADEEMEIRWIDADSPLTYHDTSIGTPDPDWTESGYDDLAWVAGTNGIGYSKGPLDYSALIRSPLPIPQTGLLARYRFSSAPETRLRLLRVAYDDGFAAFLNGVAIAARNAPLELAPDSLATASHEGAAAWDADSVDIEAHRYLIRERLPQGVVASWDPVFVETGSMRDAMGGPSGSLEGAQVVMDEERGPVLEFDGSDLVVIPSDPSFDVLWDFSVSVWVQVAEPRWRSSRLISRDNVGMANRSGFALRTAWADGFRPTFHISQAVPAHLLMVAESDTALTGGWHHLVGVRKVNDYIRIYVDGVLRGQARDYIEGGLSNSAPISIGGYFFGSRQGEYFRGRVDEVRLYDRALSGGEVGQAYATGGIRHGWTNSENVLAVQTLNHDVNDDGLVLRAELLANRSVQTGSAAPGYLAATPYTANGRTFAGVATAPRLSQGDGVYGAAATVEIEDSGAGSVVRFTLDGSDPDESSPVLGDSVLVEPPAVLRARRFVPGLIPSAVTEVRFLDEPVLINEFLAVNTAYNPDNADLGDYSDWIEIINTSTRQVDLSGYGLTDDDAEPWKWRFPEGTVLSGNGILMVWADDFDAAPGELVQRDYSPYYFARLIRLHAPFKLSGEGEAILLHSPGGALLDRVDFGPQLPDVSMGRDPVQRSNWLRYAEPTPGRPNTTEGVVGEARAGPVEFSLPGGRYGSPRWLTLTVSEADTTIRYTLDGSRPSSRSPIAEGAIWIDRSMVVRAAAYRPGRLRGIEHVEAYLFDTNSTLPVISLAGYPDTLQDPVVGIFANAYKKREVPVHIDFYESDGSGEFHIDAGMRIVGFTIQSGPQKSVSIGLDDRWGTEELRYPIFPDRDYRLYKGFVLRSGGNDGDLTFLREGLVNTLLQGRMDVDHQAYRPARVYLNGEYYGLYNIRERQNLDYLTANHPGVAGAEIDYIEHDVLPAVVLDGDGDDYDDLVRFMETHDLAEAENYEYVGSQVDLNQFLNFQIASTYIGRYSRNHNIKFWKAKPVGRWRWVVYDVDVMWHDILSGYDTLAHITSPVPLAYAPLWSTIELRSLLANEAFKEEFIHRFVTHIQTTFAPERVHPILDTLKSAIDPEMPLQVERWPARITSLSVWEDNVENLRRFTDRRPAYQLDHLKNAFGLGTMSSVSVTYAAEDGSVQVHGVDVPSGFSGEYFDNVPVRLEAIPGVARRFVGWTGMADGSDQAKVAVNPSGGLQLTALFEPDPGVQLLPAGIGGEFVASNGPSAWVAEGDIRVASGGRLVLEAGTTLLMPDRASIVVHGALEVRGTESEPVTIAANPSAGARRPRYLVNEPSFASGPDPRWGGLLIDRATEPVRLEHLRFFGASHVGAGDLGYTGGITAVESDITMRNLTAQDVVQPILVLGGRVELRDSFIQITKTGDGINVKGADLALVENCEFVGGHSFDTDAIDYDQLAEGYIRSNVIHGFDGENSDGVDLGEGSTGVLVEGNRIFDCSDKGVSVGQASRVVIRGNLIYGCAQGVAVKDAGSLALIDRTTFFNNARAVSAYEKNLGRGGGVAVVANSILSFSRDAAVFVDPHGVVTTEYCLANTGLLPGAGNLYDAPEFVAPAVGDFRLRSASSAVDAGDPSAELDPDGSRADMGAIPYEPLSFELRVADLLISEVHFNPSSEQGSDKDYEYVELYNPGWEPLDVGGYRFVLGIEFTFPEGTVVLGRQRVLVAHNRLTYADKGYPVFQWDSGRLANEGELIVLVDAEGFAVDLVQFGTADPWPEEPNGGGPSLMVLDPLRSNALASNWASGIGVGGTPGRANWIGDGHIRVLPEGGGGIEITWEATPGFEFQLEFCPALPAGEWSAVGDPILAEEERLVLHPTGTVLDGGFYRLRLRTP